MALRVRYRTGAALLHDGTTVDLGMGGAFIETPRPPARGSEVIVYLTSPTAWDPLEIHCEVRWTTEATGDLTPGFGVCFENLEGAQASALHALLQNAGFGDPAEENL